MKIGEITGEKWDGNPRISTESAVLCSQPFGFHDGAAREAPSFKRVSIAGRNGGGPRRGRLRGAKPA